MTEDIQQPFPMHYKAIATATRACGFTMASDLLTCCLLRTLAATKPAGKFLEMGTGTGLSTSWILDGIDAASELISVDKDPAFLKIAQQFLGDDQRLRLIESDGGEWMEQNKTQKFDYIFADTWHGKYLLTEDALSMLNKGGLYIIDDMLPQPNWPEGHNAKVIALIRYLEAREDLVLTKQAWASGIIIAVKK